MIITRFGTPVKFIDARVEYVERRSNFRKRGGKVAVEIIPVYQVRAMYSGPHRDGIDSTGKMLCDGQWVDAVEFKADNGWTEICDAMEDLGLNLRG